ncbi:MAG: spermidine synthase [Rhodothermales bacterium]|jgi:spermidine synthase
MRDAFDDDVYATVCMSAAAIKKCMMCILCRQRDMAFANTNFDLPHGGSEAAGEEQNGDKTGGDALHGGESRRYAALCKHGAVRRELVASAHVARVSSVDMVRTPQPKWSYVMSPKVYNRLLILCFLLSGITGLIYEIIWEKYMAKFLGAGAYSQAAVLATFMLGLGLGSHFLGRFAERIRSPARAYAVLELIIGGYAIIFPLLVSVGEKTYASLVTNDTPFMVILLVKFIISFVMMAPPAIMMGGTLPVMSKHIIRSRKNSGAQLAKLYFINTLGAVLGCLIAGFVVIGNLGLSKGLLVTGIINLVLGTVVLLFSSKVQSGGAELAPAEPANAEPEPAEPLIETPAWRRQVRGFMLVAFSTGLVAMLYEVVWIRVLSNILGTTTYSFALMLAVFIFGIALGSLIVSRFVDSIREVTGALVALQLVTILSVAAVMPLFERLPYVFHILSTSLEHTITTFYVFAVLKFLMCTVIMLVPCTCSGMMLPLVTRVAMGDGKSVGKAVGSLFACNTFGTIVASLGTGLLLIPTFGTFKALCVGMAMNAAIILLLVSQATWKKQTRVIVAVCSVVFTAIVISMTPSMNPHLLITSEYRHGKAKRFDSFAAYKQYHEQLFKLIYINEDTTSTVIVTEEAGGNRGLYINGKADASSTIEGDLITQTLCGVLPAIVAPGKTRTLVVGMGTGNTAHVAGLPSSIQSVDVVEISEDVIHAADQFADINGNILQNPKMNIHVEDARTFMHLTREPYDVIINEPSNPWIAGIGNLFTREYFEQAYEVLEDDGVFIQWLQTYETSDPVILSVLHTLTSVFPHVVVWYAGQVDLLITCTKAPPVFDFAASEAQFAELADYLRKAEIHSVDEVFLRYMGDETDVARVLSRYSPVRNTDDFPFVEYEAPKQLFIRKQPRVPQEFDQRLLPRNESRFPFFDRFATKTPQEMFTHFEHFHARTPLTMRMRKLQVMTEGRWYVTDPWYRELDLNSLKDVYANTPPTKRSWFIRELFGDYEKLRNPFVAIPFVPFLHEIVADYRRAHPRDEGIRMIQATLTSEQPEFAPDKWGYTPSYPFGKDGTPAHPGGYDGHPADHPANPTPGKAGKAGKPLTPVEEPPAKDVTE